MANTNWANHGEKSTKFPGHTVVDEDHCDEMVSLFTTFVDEHSPNNDDTDTSSGMTATNQGSDDSVDALTGSFAAVTTASIERECGGCGQLFETRFKGRNPICKKCHSS